MKVTFSSIPLLLAAHATAQTPTPSYCASAPSSIYIPSYTLQGSSPTVTPPLPCPGVYAVQEGYCCSNGFSCSGGTCTCPNGHSSSRSPSRLASPKTLSTAAVRATCSAACAAAVPASLKAAIIIRPGAVSCVAVGGRPCLT
jgi:hypothetical protein